MAMGGMMQPSTMMNPMMAMNSFMAMQQMQQAQMMMMMGAGFGSMGIYNPMASLQGFGPAPSSNEGSQARSAVAPY